MTHNPPPSPPPHQIYQIYIYICLILITKVRESKDHGPYNSWDRVPYITTLRNGTASIVPADKSIHNNFIIGTYNSQEVIDTDDGSAYIQTYDNFFAYGEGRIGIWVVYLYCFINCFGSFFGGVVLFFFRCVVIFGCLCGVGVLLLYPLLPLLFPISFFSSHSTPFFYALNCLTGAGGLKSDFGGHDHKWRGNVVGYVMECFGAPMPFRYFHGFNDAFVNNSCITVGAGLGASSIPAHCKNAAHNATEQTSLTQMSASFLFIS